MGRGLRMLAIYEGSVTSGISLKDHVGIKHFPLKNATAISNFFSTHPTDSSEGPFENTDSAKAREIWQARCWSQEHYNRPFRGQSAIHIWDARERHLPHATYLKPRKKKGSSIQSRTFRFVVHQQSGVLFGFPCQSGCGRAIIS